MPTLSKNEWAHLKRYVRSLSTTTNRAMEKNGDLDSVIRVGDIYNSVRGLVSLVFGEKESEKIEFNRVAAKIKGVESKFATIVKAKEDNLQ